MGVPEPSVGGASLVPPRLVMPDRRGHQLPIDAPPTPTEGNTYNDKYVIVYDFAGVGMFAIPLNCNSKVKRRTLTCDCIRL